MPDKTAATLIVTGKDASLIEGEVISSEVWEQNALPSFQKPSPTLAKTLCLEINMAELFFSLQRCTAREIKKVCNCLYQACVGVWAHLTPQHKWSECIISKTQEQLFQLQCLLCSKVDQGTDLHSKENIIFSPRQFHDWFPARLPTVVPTHLRRGSTMMGRNEVGGNCWDLYYCLREMLILPRVVG